MWKFLIPTYVGSTSAQSNDTNFSFATVDWVTNGSIFNIDPPGLHCAPHKSLSVTLSGTCTVHAIWTIDGTTIAPNPPAQTWFAITSTTNATAYNFGTSAYAASCDNGFGDPDGHIISQGIHAFLKSTSSGRWDQLVNLSATVSTTDFPAAQVHGGTTPELGPGGRNGGIGSAAGLGVSGLVSAQLLPTADNYDFTGYPNPPPAGTTPFATTAANDQINPVAPAIPPGYGAFYHTGDLAANCIKQMQKDAIVYVFGHAGNQFQAVQSFFDGHGTWGYIVATPWAKQKVIDTWNGNDGTLNPNDIFALTDLPMGSLGGLKLVVFEGCDTGYEGVTDHWDSITLRAIAKGATCAIGWLPTIFSDNSPGKPGPGAETWATDFWLNISKGKTINKAQTDAMQGQDLLHNMRQIRIDGTATAALMPSLTLIK